MAQRASLQRHRRVIKESLINVASLLQVCGEVFRVRRRDDLEAIGNRALEGLDAAVAMGQRGLVGLRIVVGAHMLALRAGRLDCTDMWYQGLGAQ